MITYEAVVAAADCLLGAVIIVSMLVNWRILILYQEFPPKPMTEMGLQVTGSCRRWARDVSGIYQNLQPTRPVIEPTSMPRRPFKKPGLRLEAYEVIKEVFIILRFSIGWETTYLLNPVAALDGAGGTASSVMGNGSSKGNGRESESEGSGEVHCMKIV